MDSCSDPNSDLYLSMQNRKPPSGLFANHIAAANGDDDCLVNLFKMLSSSHSFKTTNSVHQ